MSDNALQPKPFDVREFRTALGGFVTGVTVVTTTINGSPIGFTANSFTSVSLDPPLILVCIGKSSSNFANFQQVDAFCVSILAESQRTISQKFASKGIDRFEGVAWTAGDLGNPVIDNAVAWFDCTLHQRIDAGDHHILVGKVSEFGHNVGSPLAFCRGNYVLFELDQQILSSTHHRARFGAILETPEGIVFVPGEKPGSLALPTTLRLGTRKANDGLYRTLGALGLDFDIEFLFSVWEEDAADRLSVYYRGIASGTVDPALGQVIPLDAIPHDKLGHDDNRLLNRYKQERASFRFSVYNGTATAGNFWEVPGTLPRERADVS